MKDEFYRWDACTLSMSAPIYHPLFLYLLILLTLQHTCQAQYTCSPTQRCELGCCTKFGSCGLGPDSCGPENCISDCDRKAECDPGWGSHWSSKSACPLNVCCSKFGFCGTTEEFCGNNQVVRPSCSGLRSIGKKSIGYYEGWSTTRPCDGMFPEGINANAFTHLNYAFAFIDPKTFQVAPMSQSDINLFTRFTNLKIMNPGLQTWISIGGWSMNDVDQPTATTFSDLAASPDAQAKFFDSLISFMQTYKFDGVDIDWEYPVAPERSGRPEDYVNYVQFLKALRSAFAAAGHNYGVTITIPSSYWYLQHFDVVALSQVVDWFNVMSYDLHGTWDSTNKYIGSVAYAHTNLTEIENTLDLLWRNNIDPAKVILGLGFYGRAFTMQNEDCVQAGCPFVSGAEAGPCTQSTGTLSFAEIGEIIDSGQAKVSYDPVAGVKQAVWSGNQWVSYDDKQTLQQKIDYANNRCLGGTMVWAVSTDTADGNASQLLSAASGISLMTAAGINVQRKPCQWGDCEGQCDPGFSPTAFRFCLGKHLPAKQPYCCPSDDQPACTWRGGEHAWGLINECMGKCEDGETDITHDAHGDGRYVPCTGLRGWKRLCCKTLPPPPPPETLQLNDFTDLLGRFADFPVCLDFGLSVPTKRQGYTSKPLSPFENAKLMITIASLFSSVNLNGLLSLYQGAYDKLFANRYGATRELVTKYRDLWPDMDPNEMALEIMCAGTEAEKLLTRAENRASALCTVPGPERREVNEDAVTDSANGHNNTSKVKRIISNLFEGQGVMPGWGTIIQGIMNGRLSLLYARFLRTRIGQEREDNIVEIAWQIPDGDTGTYRDLRFEDDRYVVLHFHVDHVNNNRLAVVAATAFHGWRTRNTNTWRQRVDNSDHPRNDPRYVGHGTFRNQRAHLVECPYEDRARRRQLYWYIDDQDFLHNLYPNDPDGSRAFAQFGSWLYTSHILNPRYIFDAQRSGVALTQPAADGNQYPDWTALVEPDQAPPNLSWGWAVNGDLPTGPVHDPNNEGPAIDPDIDPLGDADGNGPPAPTHDEFRKKSEFGNEVL